MLLPETFSSRVALAFSVVVAALLVASAWVVERRSQTFHEAEVRRRLDAIAVATSDDAKAVFEGRMTREAFGEKIAKLVAETGVRFTLIRADGSVVADSSTFPVENHGDRPEFLEAMKSGRGSSARQSNTTMHPMSYDAWRIDSDHGPLGVLRVSAFLDQLDAEVAILHQAVIYTAIGVVLLGILFAFITSRVLARPLESIASAADAVASGAKSSAIRVEGPREVRRLADAINAMADELRAQMTSIERARAETESILESLKEGVVAISRGERLMRMNVAAARLLGIDRPLDPGEQLWRAVRFPELEAALRQVILEGHESVHIDANSPRNDGSVISLTITPLGNGGGAVAILSDVTDIRRLEKVRSDFVANVSHEMRTPLAVIMGAIETLEDPTLGDADQRKFLEMARLNADRMKNIVEDLLELSKIEAEGDTIALEPMNIETPIRNSMSALQYAADTKHIHVELHPPPQSPILVQGNMKRLEQVFSNLIDNAIKYTPEGGNVRVRIDLTDKEVCIEVEDTGIGIPQHSLSRVFERFYRVDKGRSRDMGGTGLGLAIVKHATRAHGGRVTVRSEEGRGTTFGVSLPRVSVGRPAPQPVD